MSLLRNILRALNIVSDAPPFEPRIWIHEDDLGMRSLYPLASAAEVARDLAEALETSERSRDPSGFGWNEIHEINPPTIDFAKTDLSLDAAIAALQALLPRILRFSAGISSSQASGDDPLAIHEADAWCFGFDATCFIKLEVEAGKLSQIWFECADAPLEQATKLRAGLEAIDALTPCLVADYWINVTGSVGDPGFMDRYFAAL